MATKAKKRPIYEEPEDYFPKEIRKAMGLGEYSEAAKKSAKKTAAKKTTAKKPKK